MQSGNKPRRPSKHRRNSSVLPPPSKQVVQRKPPKVPASSLPLALRLPSFQTSTYPPTRFCSCGICPTTQTRKVFLLSLVASKGSRKSDWCRVVRESHSSSTRPRLEQSARRRLRRACPWATRARRFALPTSDSSRGWYVACYKISRSRSFWRLEGLIFSVCVLENTESFINVLLRSQCIKGAYHMKLNIFPSR